MRISLLLVGLLAGPLVLVPSAPAGDNRLDDLLKMVPDSANAVIAIDIWGLRNSPLGLKENWAKKQEQNFLAGQSSIPPMASNLVVAAQFDSGLRSPYIVALARTDQRVPLDKLAHAEKSEPDEVAGKPVFLSPRNAYFVELSPKVVGAMRPANRQSLGRWLRASSRTVASTLNDYLSKAIQPENAPQIVMAVDLADVVDPSVIRRGLNRTAITKIIGEKKADFENVVRTLAKMRGATFQVRVGDDIQGEFEVEFTTAAQPLWGVVKPLTIQILEELGIRIDDMDDWKPRLKEQGVGLRGKLSHKGLRQVLSIMQAPAQSSDGSDMAEAPGSTRPASTAQVTQRYFTAVANILTDLKTMKGQNIKGYATWYNKYSEQIDNLPILNVDPEMVAYATKVSAELRAMGASLQGVDLQSSYLQRQKQEVEFQTLPYATWGAAGGYGWGGAYGAYYPSLYGSVNNYQQVYNMQDQMVTQSKGARVEIWKQIDLDTSAIRRKMTEKYQVEFSTPDSPSTQRTIRTQDR